MDELSLDMQTVDAQLAEPTRHVESNAWLARRALGFGASDVPALLIALGVVSTEGTPKYILDKARATNRTCGAPRIFAEKAGVALPLKGSSAASRGTERERELLAQWRMMLSRGVYYDEFAESVVVHESVTHADSMLRCVWPLVDRQCRKLAATLDAWATDTLGGELVVELKCSASERRDLPWWWRAQVHAQLAVTGADYGLLVCGEHWASWHGNDGPIRVWPVERDESAIARIRDAAEVGWDIVERLQEDSDATE
jgi:hypothetical protein